MIIKVKTWNNGSWHDDGNGYGIKIGNLDIQKHFKRKWGEINLKLDKIDILLNIDKDSFWNGKCGELISKKIGIWLIERNLSKWPKGKPYDLCLIVKSPQNFILSQCK